MVKEYKIQATTSRKPFSPRQMKYVPAKRRGPTYFWYDRSSGPERPPRSPDLTHVKLLPLLLEGQYKNAIKYINLAGFFCGDHTDNKFNDMLRQYIANDTKNFETVLLGWKSRASQRFILRRNAHG